MFLLEAQDYHLLILHFVNKINISVRKTQLIFHRILTKKTN